MTRTDYDGTREEIMDGDYDYINNGRQSSTLHVESEDGVHFGTKEVAVSWEDYPKNYTCHIRDP